MKGLNTDTARSGAPGAHELTAIHRSVKDSDIEGNGDSPVDK